MYVFRDIYLKEKDILMCLTGGTIGKIVKVEKIYTLIVFLGSLCFGLGRKVLF